MSKVVEVVPINFMLRSAQEQRNIIYSFVSVLENQPHQAANQGTDTSGRDQPPSGYRSEGDGTGNQ